MNRNRLWWRQLALPLGAASLAMVAATAHSQSPGSRPLTLVVPYAAGASTDALARLIGRKHSELTGQAVVIENRAGGSGAAAATLVKQAPPDGHVLLVGNPAILAINPLITKDLPYDGARDFAPVQLLYNAVHFLYVPASSPAKSMAELIALARSRQGGVSYASQGVGSTGHLGGAMLQALTGAQFVHIPYKGSALGMTDLAAGRVDLFFSIHASAGPHLRGGNIRTLAIASTERIRTLPEVPTTAEAGFPSVILDFWFGLFAPAATPPAVVARLNDDFRRAVHDPEITRRMTEEILDPLSATPGEIAAMLRADRSRYEKAFRDSGVLGKE